MSHSIFSTISNPFITPKTIPISHGQVTSEARFRPEMKARSKPESEPELMGPKLTVGSPIIIIEAPKMVKTAATVPCLRVNDGLVKPGDVGRIVGRKPMDVWAIRLSIGTYLIGRKYFEALELPEE